MARRLPSASLLEGARFSAEVAIPNVVQGVFRRRRRALAVAALADADGHAAGLLAGLRRKHGPGPVWVRVVKDQMLVVLRGEDARRVLDGSPEPFAADPETKRKGMVHFQPDALTISRGEVWADRRRFTEAVLDTGRPRHRHAERFLAVAREETARLAAQAAAEHHGRVEWEPFNEAVRRVTRRVVLGDAAAEDRELTDTLAEMMDAANGLPGETSPRYEPFMARIAEYVAAAEPGSLVAGFADAPRDARTAPAGQVPHWLFASGDTLAINLFRALALLAGHPAQRDRVEAELAGGRRTTAAGIGELDYLTACLQEAMRLWPTTPMLSRELTEDVEWEDGAEIPAGSQVLIVNTFLHRDPETHPYADRFAPEAWTEGDAGTDPAFNHFSAGPQGCPGAALALFLGTAMMAELLGTHHVGLVEPRLDPDRPLPHTLDFFALKLELAPL